MSSFQMTHISREVLQSFSSILSFTLIRPSSQQPRPNCDKSSFGSMTYSNYFPRTLHPPSSSNQHKENIVVNHPTAQPGAELNPLDISSENSPRRSRTPAMPAAGLKTVATARVSSRTHSSIQPSPSIPYLSPSPSQEPPHRRYSIVDD